MLGIDGFNIYNIRKSKAKEGATGPQTMINPSSMVSNGGTSTGQTEKKRGSFFTEFLSKKILGVKRKARPISTIDDIVKIDSKTIQIIFIEKNGNKKAIVYECQTGDNCSEIVAKLNFLRVRLAILLFHRKIKRNL